MGPASDWNRTAVQRLIMDAEDTLSVLNRALAEPDPEDRLRALRNGRRAYNEIVTRRRNFLLTPMEGLALERLLDNIKSRLRFIRERIT